MKVFITGANGFVGKHLCQHLQNLGYEIIKGLRIADPKQQNIATNIIYGDIAKFHEWFEVLAGVDVVIHLAARVHQLNKEEHSAKQLYYAVNVNATENILRAAIKASVKKFIFLSTVKVHGEQNNIKENAVELFNEKSILNPLGDYACTKVIAEKKIKSIANSSAIETTIIRPPLIYGPNVKANMYRLLQSVKKGYPLPFKSIHNKRSFIYIEHLTDIIANIIQNPNAANKTFLVSDGSALSTPELVQAIANSLHLNPRLFSVSPKLLELAAKLAGKQQLMSRITQSLAIDSSWCTQVLKWKPKYTLQEALLNSFGKL